MSWKDVNYQANQRKPTNDHRELPFEPIVFHGQQSSLFSETHGYIASPTKSKHTCFRSVELSWDVQLSSEILTFPQRCWTFLRGVKLSSEFLQACGFSKHESLRKRIIEETYSMEDAILARLHHVDNTSNVCRHCGSGYPLQLIGHPAFQFRRCLPVWAPFCRHRTTWAWRRPTRNATHWTWWVPPSVSFLSMPSVRGLEASDGSPRIMSASAARRRLVRTSELTPHQFQKNN